jgi:hypothetical protein
MLDNFESAVVKSLDDLGGELAQMRARNDRLEREVANLAQAVTQGDFSPALRAAHATREREISDLTAKLLEPRPDSLRVKLRNICGFVTQNMRDIREIVNSDTTRTWTMFAKHIEKITLTPTEEHYVASRTWNLLWRGSIGGAGGAGTAHQRATAIDHTGIGGVDPYAAHPPSARAACQIVDALRASSGILVKESAR